MFAIPLKNNGYWVIQVQAADRRYPNNRIALASPQINVRCVEIGQIGFLERAGAFEALEPLLMTI